MITIRIRNYTHLKPMYVCLCNPVTDREIRGCVKQGARTLSDLQMQLGVAAQCGMCASAALAIVDEETCCSSEANCSYAVSPA
jgi:bacterioferritin-associated ferredoxin